MNPWAIENSLMRVDDHDREQNVCGKIGAFLREAV